MNRAPVYNDGIRRKKVYSKKVRDGKLKKSLVVEDLATQSSDKGNTAMQQQPSKDDRNSATRTRERDLLPPMYYEYTKARDDIAAHIKKNASKKQTEQYELKMIMYRRIFKKMALFGGVSMCLNSDYTSVDSDVYFDAIKKLMMEDTYFISLDALFAAKAIFKNFDGPDVIWDSGDNFSAGVGVLCVEFDRRFYCAPREEWAWLAKELKKMYEKYIELVKEILAIRLK